MLGERLIGTHGAVSEVAVEFNWRGCEGVADKGRFPGSVHTIRALACPTPSLHAVERRGVGDVSKAAMG